MASRSPRSIRFASSTSSCGGEQPDLADVLEEQLQGIGGHVRLQVERLFLAPAAFFAGSVGHRFGGGFLRRVHVLDQLDARLLEVPVEVLDVGLVEIDLGHRRGDVAEGEHAELLPAGDQAFYLLKLLKLSYQHAVSTRFPALRVLVLAIKGRRGPKVVPLKKRTGEPVREVKLVCAAKSARGAFEALKRLFAS